MKNINFLILTSLITLLTAPFAYAVLPELSENGIRNVLISQDINSEKIKQKAEAITVKIKSDNSAGSGVIIAKEGNTYTVLTNAHVINSKIPNQIVTIDGKSHEAKVIKQGNSLEGNDLAVLTFNSSDSYQVATLATNSDIQENQRVYSVGFTEETDEFYFTQGNINLQAPKPFLGGYQIGYDIDVKSGMSGGALLNEKGELIGVNGLLKRPILNDAYNYLDGSKPFEQNIPTYRNLSFAVPVETLMEVAPNLALIPDEWKTGLNVAENVDNIARQITVRIDNEDQVIGSGAIIGKDGDTYYVFTACHVVSDYDCMSGEVKDNYTLVTPDGEKYPLTKNNIILPEKLDAAIIKFESEKEYKVATIGKYNTSRLQKHLVFVSGFPGELNGVRKFTAGYQLHLDQGLASSFRSNSEDIKKYVDTSGYELRYTNLSRKGMSGGPVLDINGQVIGINTGQDGEQRSLTEIGKLGYAFGVPASTLIGFANQKQINLNYVDEMPVPLKEQQLKIAKQHPAFIIEKPPENSNENAWLTYGNELWRIRQYKEAIAALNKAIELDDDDNFAEAYYALGLVYRTQAINTGNDSLDMKALAAFDQAISLSEDFMLKGQAWYLKSISLRNLRRDEEALVAINQAIKGIYPDDATFYRQRALILQDLERYVEAKEAYDESLKISPLPITYFSKCLLLLFDIKEPKAALDDCNKAIDLGFIEAYSYRGIAHFALGKEQAALDDHNQAIAFAPNSSHLYQMRAGMYFFTGKYELAIADYNKAIEVYPQNRDLASFHLASLYSGLAFVYQRMDDYQQQIVNLTKALELDPSDHLTYQIRGQSHNFNGQYNLAIQDMTKAIELQPDNADYYHQRGGFKSSLGDNQGALEDYNRAIELDRNNASAYSKRASLYTDQFQDYKKAMEDYDRAIEINPKYGQAYESRGLLRHKLLSDLPGALEDYNRAIALIEAPDPIVDSVYLGSLPEDVPSNFPYQLKTSYNKYDSAYGQRGDVRLQLKDYQGALEDYNEAIRRNPNNGDHYVGRGDYYAQTNQAEKAQADYKKAIEAYSETLKTDPKYPNQVAFVYSNRAKVYRKLKNNQAAIADYSKAITLTTNNPKSFYIFRGSLYSEIKEHKLAIKDFSKVIELEPNSPGSYVFRGLEYLKIKNIQAAIEDYSKIIELNQKAADPQYFDYYTFRGELYQQTKNYQGAIEDFSTFIKLQPNTPESIKAYAKRGVIYTQVKNYSAAIEDFSTVIKLNEKAANPQYFAAYMGRGELYQQTKNYQGAIEDFSSFIKLQPNSPQSMQAYAQRGVTYTQVKNYSAAIEDFSTVIKLNENIANPQYFTAYMGRGRLHQQSKNYPEAIQDFSTFIKLQPENHQGYTYRCMVYTDLKDYNQAMKDCNQALAIAPNNPEVYLSSAALNSGLKNYSAAIKDANKIIELAPAFPVGYWLRGAMYWAQNNPTKALSDCELALSKNDQFAPAISCIASIKYEQGDKQKAIELWQKALTIQDDLADTKLALAVGLYHQGQPEKALSLAKEAIKIDERLKDINHLQDNLWGKQLIEDTKPLLNKVK
ncbi:serine protease [Crocosphaera sp.]|uniref:serine protease n=1 Tax=Crocosphaera sp. TaxID=2729996 RepID=UPI002626CEFF|nr:serine protease [Crocosphaera sp.]MDJ0578705.1 tetratricopeptide repeat protein [Crocosphaera sp.]